MQPTWLRLPEHLFHPSARGAFGRHAAGLQRTEEANGVAVLGAGRGKKWGLIGQLVFHQIGEQEV